MRAVILVAFLCASTSYASIIINSTSVYGLRNSSYDGYEELHLNTATSGKWSLNNGNQRANLTLDFKNGITAKADVSGSVVGNGLADMKMETTFDISVIGSPALVSFKLTNGPNYYGEPNVSFDIVNLADNSSVLHYLITLTPFGPDKDSISITNYALQPGEYSIELIVDASVRNIAGSNTANYAYANGAGSFSIVPEVSSIHLMSLIAVAFFVLPVLKQRRTMTARNSN